MRDENLNKLKELFVAAMSMDSFPSVAEIHRADFDDMRRMTLDKWDSLAHVTLVAAIESEFGISLDLADFERMTSFKAIKLLLAEKGL